MNKKIIALAAVASLCTLSACGNSSQAKVSDAESIILSGDKVTFSKQDLFEMMAGQDYSATIVGHIAKDVALLEGIEESELASSAEEQMANYKTIYQESYDTLVNNYGGEEAFKDYLMRSVASNKLRDLYLDAHMDEYIAQYAPYMAQMAFFSDLDTANTFLERVNAGEDFAKTATDLGYTLSANAQVFTDKDSMATEVKEYVNNTSDTGLSGIINTVTTTTDADGNKVDTPRYYIINVIDRDVENFKEDFKYTISTGIEDATIMSYYFDKYDVNIYDQRTYDLLSAKYSGLN